MMLSSSKFGSLRKDPAPLNRFLFKACVYPVTGGSLLFSSNAHGRHSKSLIFCFTRHHETRSILKEHGGFPFHRKACRRVHVSVAESKLEPWTSRVGEAVNKSSNDRLLQVVLCSPQIPGNTGAIARTCAATAVGLHLVEPLGFKIDDTKLKRAGLDYWPYVIVKVHSSWGEFVDYFKEQEGDKRLLAFTKKGTNLHTDVAYKPGDWLVFGSEQSGLSLKALNDCANESYGGGTVRIPMLDTYVRCLNLSVSVGIAVYEASRQLGFEKLDASCASIESEHNDNFGFK